jgi:hypothetical protein
LPVALKTTKHLLSTRHGINEVTTEDKIVEDNRDAEIAAINQWWDDKIAQMNIVVPRPTSDPRLEAIDKHITVIEHEALPVEPTESNSNTSRQHNMPDVRDADASRPDTPADRVRVEIHRNDALEDPASHEAIDRLLRGEG